VALILFAFESAVQAGLVIPIPTTTGMDTLRPTTWTSNIVDSDELLRALSKPMLWGSEFIQKISYVSRIQHERGKCKVMLW